MQKEPYFALWTGCPGELLTVGTAGSHRHTVENCSPVTAAADVTRGDLTCMTGCRVKTQATLVAVFKEQHHVGA